MFEHKQNLYDEHPAGACSAEARNNKQSELT